MRSHKNKNSNFCKKFLSSTLIILLMFSVNITAIPLTSADPPSTSADDSTPNPPDKPSNENYVEISHPAGISIKATPPPSIWDSLANFINKLTYCLFDSCLYPFSALIFSPCEKRIGMYRKYNKRLNDLENQIQPVGSIYMSVSNENPENIFGGTWEPWGAGRVPVGVSTTQSVFSSSEMTGGSSSHVHTLDSAAAMIGSDWGRPETLAFTARNVGNMHGTIYTLKASNPTPDSRGRSHNTALTGTTDPSANLQPYITCYMWKRVA